MSSFEAEIKAAKARIAEIENNLAKAISDIQSDATARIVEATRIASVDTLSLRIFLQSMGGSSNPIGLSPTLTATKSSSSKSNPDPKRRSATKRKGASKAAVISDPTKTAKFIFLTMVGEAEAPMSGQQIDDAMVARGFKKASPQRQRYDRKVDGMVAVTPDNKYTLTEVGRAHLAEMIAAN